MQTVYFTTRNFVRREGTVVDFEDYRRRMSKAADAPSTCVSAIPSAAVPALPSHEEPEASARRSREIYFPLKRLPDLCATLAIVVMAITVVVRFLQV